jgi:hypothetical protein
VVGSRRTSLVIDAPDGRIPAPTAEARARIDKLEAARERPAEGPEDRPVAERCLLGFNAGPPMVPAGYNMNVQIVQTRDHVMIMNEMVHSARVVPLDGRPHLNLPQWVGRPTANDPTTWARPWTAQIPTCRTNDQIFEYACHEANYGMTNLLQGARSSIATR